MIVELKKTNIIVRNANDFKNYVDYVEELEQQCKKQKEVINRIFNETTETRNIIINNRGDNILTHGSLIHYLGIVEDILKEVSE
jgi:hypothetical protein